MSNRPGSKSLHSPPSFPRQREFACACFGHLGDKRGRRSKDRSGSDPKEVSLDNLVPNRDQLTAKNPIGKVWLAKWCSTA